MANRQRGEAEIVLDGKTYTLAPTFGAIAEIEDALGRSFLEIGGEILAVARDAKNQAEGRPTVRAVGVTTIATLIHATAKAAGHTETLEEIGEAVLAEGVYGVLGPLVELSAIPLAGTKAPEGNAVARATGPAKRKSTGRK